MGLCQVSVRQSRSSLLSIINSLRSRLLLFSDLVLKSAVLRGFCCEIQVAEVMTGRRLDAVL